MRRYRALVFALALIGFTADGWAQEYPTVFVHGLASNADTWDGAAGRLATRLSIRPYRVTLPWQAFFESQATDLENQMSGERSANVLAVGHSNGGVVARQWSRTRDLSALITVGSPNQGAPIVNHLFEWFQFLDDILPRISNVSHIFANDVDQITWWWLPAQWTPRFNAAIDVWATAGNGLLSLGLDARYPVLPEMRVGSAFLTGLNAPGNLDREASQVAARAAILSVPVEFNHGGPFRLIDPDHYEDWHNGLLITGVALDGLAGIIRITADAQDRAAFDLADQVSSVADWFLAFEEVWCRTVSDPSPYALGHCYEHDGIVPAWSQAYDYPRLPLIVNPNGPVHTRETAESDAQIFEALTNLAHVPTRSGDSGATPPELLPNPDAPSAPDPATGPVSSSPTHSGTGDPAPEAFEPAVDPGSVPALAPPTGRFKGDGWGGCYWDPNDSGPDQCAPEPPHIGRYKVNGAGACYWDANDDGPDQCVP